MYVSKPSICFWIRVISIKWRNKLLIHSINLAGLRKSACSLQLLVFLEIWVIGPFWHWKTQVFPKSWCHHDLKAFCEIGYKSVLLNIIENRLLVTWFFWLHMIIYDYISSVFCIVPKKVLLLKYRKSVSHLINGYHYAKVVENARITFSISPYCTCCFLVKKTSNFLK